MRLAGVIQPQSEWSTFGRNGGKEGEENGGEITSNTSGSFGDQFIRPTGISFGKTGKPKSIAPFLPQSAALTPPAAIKRVIWACENCD